MEHPSKRRRLLKDTPGSENLPSTLTSNPEEEHDGQHTGLQDDPYLPLHVEGKIHAGNHQYAHSRHHRHQHLHLHQNGVRPRDDSDTTVSSTATVVDVIINDGTTDVAAITVPYASTVVSVGSVAVTIETTADSTQAPTMTAPSNASSTASSAASSTSLSSPSPTSAVAAMSLRASNSSVISTMIESVSVINGTATSTFYFPTHITASNTSETSSTGTRSSSSSSSSSSETRSLSSSSSSAFASSTSGGASSGGIATIGGSTTTSASGSGSTTGSGSNSNSSTTTPTPQIVGGVVGGVAGFALILAVLLWLLRSYRKKMKNREALAGAGGSSLPPTRERPVSMRSTHNSLTAALIPASFGRWRNSNQTATTAASNEGPASERGFQKLGGRKLTGVLSGGDPYGGNYGAFEPGSRDEPSGNDRNSDVPETLARQSAIRDFSVEQSGPIDAGLPIMRPGPSRTPIKQSASFTSLPRTACSNGSATPKHAVPDAVGRSLAAQDGSKGSRFREGV